MTNAAGDDASGDDTRCDGDGIVGVTDLLLLLADYGTADTAGGCGGNGPVRGGAAARPSVEVVATDGVVGMTTVRLAVGLDATQANVYAMAGTPDSPMVFPPAFQAATPFGADIGGVNPAFVPIMPPSEFDSWLTVGVTDGNDGAISAIGLGLDAWSVSSGISANNGAVFWMNPEYGPSGSDIVMAQLTVPSTEATTATARLQGRSAGGAPDWFYDATWSW
jgi:hypothetical protein